MVYPCLSGIEVWSRAWFTTGSLAGVLARLADLYCVSEDEGFGRTVARLDPFS